MSGSSVAMPSRRSASPQNRSCLSASFRLIWSAACSSARRLSSPTCTGRPFGLAGQGSASVVSQKNPSPNVSARPRWWVTGKSEPYMRRRGPNSCRIAASGSASHMAEESNQTLGNPRNAPIPATVSGP